jgi:serine/threonine protein kinase
VEPLNAAPRKALGRYELVKHLASGGMAEVMLARVTGIEGFERHVVLKRIRDAQARDARFVQMFLDEARLAASLHHTNIAQVHDIGQEAGEYFFAMEYVHGEDLRKLLMHLAERDAKLPFEHIITIITASAAALHHAHEHRSPDRKLLGIVHRDVSPANILVGYDGNVKVVDFGIAKATQRTTETQSGVMKGKVAYMSPEQCVGQVVDRRSDIFCLGIVLYELVTVRRLFKGDNDFLTMSSITRGVIPPPSGIRPDLAPELEAIILKALAAKPEDRYQTANEMRVALEQYATKAGLPTSTTALADFMHAQFGERPVPWLADDEGDSVVLTYDFDGSASGVVPAPTGFEVPSGFVEGSPILRARTKAITGAPEQSGALPPHAIIARETSQTKVPATVPASSPARPSARRRVWLIGGGAGLAVTIALVAVLSRRGGDGATKRAGETAPVPAPPIATDPPTPRTVARDPEPVAPAIVPAVVPDPDKPAVVKPKPKRTATKKPRHGTWDPNSLFPKKP